mmetsp:Transcript_66691/g.198454  ORF Transcript_66691/g.198454 Transcript_66691/m.198454 type:complete len:245 (-) Transcript_66691:253-987(-)
MTSGLPPTTARWQHFSRNFSKAQRRFSSLESTTGSLRACSKLPACGAGFRLMPSNFLTRITPMMSSLLSGLLGSLLKTNSLEWPQCRTLLMHASSTTSSWASILASWRGDATTSAVLWCSSRTPWIMFISSSSRHSLFIVRTSALMSSRRCSSTSCPRALSRNRLMGHAMGSISSFTTRTSGENAAARGSWFLPVKSAEGMISPKMRTTVTERITATQPGTKRSRKRGSASLAAALHSRSVTNR